jgi:ribosomal protein S18 acetylase RimI-like enzyme
MAQVDEDGGRLIDDLTIRLAVPRDADRIVAFGRAMAEETEGRRLDAAVIDAGVRTLMDRPQDGFYIVAARGNEIVGSLMITTEWSDWRNGVFWWVQSVYVKPAFRGTGIYRRMHEHVRRRAREHERVCGLRLYVDSNNELARRVYETLGMHETGYRLYEELLDASK